MKYEDLYPVILRCPYANWDNILTRELYNKIITLKLDGYLNKHTFGALPVDTSDLVADHILICTKSPSGFFEPILGAKTLPYSTCSLFNLEFTIERFLEKGGHREHLKALKIILAKTRKHGRNISYYSSWTIASKVRKDREFLALLKDLFTVSSCAYHSEERINELLGLGVPKYRTDQYFYRWGFEPVYDENENLLREIPIDFLDGLPGVFIFLKSFSTGAMNLWQSHESFWLKKCQIGHPIHDITNNKEETPPLNFRDPVQPTRMSYSV